MTSGAMAQQTVFQLKGNVKDEQGKPLAGVVVNDGVHFTQTDRKGGWVLTTDTTESKFVAISTPATCELPQQEGLARGFYVPVRELVGAKNYTFVLRKRQQPTQRFSYVAISDPQVKNAHDMERWRTETMPDLKASADSLRTYGEVVGVALGDLVFDSMNLYGEYAASVSHTGMTMFQTIGNHDFDKRYAALSRMPKGSPVYGEMQYGKWFGPVNYSFNIGQVHVITVKNIDYLGNKKYEENLTPTELEWIRQDLSYVPKGSTVFLNMHAAGWNIVSGNGNVRSAEALAEILRDYRVHVFCGHTHYMQNVEPQPGLFQHNIGAACGAWWSSWVNRCGAPNGYLIVDVDGDNVKWHYKPTGKGVDHQFKVYMPGELLSQKDCLVANIWDFDSQSKVQWYQDGKLMGDMERFEDADQEYLATTRSSNSNLHTDHLFRVRPAAEASVVKIVFSNRFGETYTQEIMLHAAPQTKVIAHRGYWKTDGSAQNSIAALVKADSIGVVGSEFDVQYTSDGVAVVNHDDDIQGHVIATSTFAELRNLKLANGETLPTLKQYLDQGRKLKTARLILEIKEQPSKEAEDKCVAEVVRLVKESGIHQKVDYISFSKNVCEQLAKQTYGSNIAYLGGDLTPQEVKAMGLNGIDYEDEVLKARPQWVKQAHDLGLTVNVWTVDKDDDISYFLGQGVDFVTTNQPIRAMDLEKR
jgi:glycerophosphoryl diester phosphodiesterase